MLERLLRCEAIRRQCWVGQRDKTDPILSQVLDIVRFVVAPERRQPPMGVHDGRVGQDFAIRSQSVDIGCVSGQEDIVGSSVGDLLPKRATRRENEPNGILWVSSPKRVN